MNEVVNKSPLVTYDSVAAAAESLASASQRPSIRGVIGALGGGSPNAVLVHLNAWKAARPSVKANDVTVDPRIATIIGEQIRIAVGEATRTAESRAADAAADSEVVADAGRRAERQIEELTEALSGSRAECQQLIGRLEMLTQEFEQSKREASAMIAVARADAESSVAAASANAAHERAAAEAALQAVARAELRLEALPALELAVKDLRARLDAERDAKAAMERACAVAIAEKRGAELRADDLRSELERLRDSTTRELTYLREKVDTLQDRLAGFAPPRAVDSGRGESQAEIGKQGAEGHAAGSD